MSERPPEVQEPGSLSQPAAANVLDIAQSLMHHRQAALELHAEIRSALAWIASGAEPSVAHGMLLKTADKWRPYLEAPDA